MAEKVATTVVDDIRALLAGIEPSDELEAQHLAVARAWSRSSDDLFRRVRPAEPDPHLAVYVVVRDPLDGALLLAQHRTADLWLPPGGHVDPGEHPVQTVRRELVEELGVTARFVAPFGERPQFLSVTETANRGEGRHHDVTLWFVVAVNRTEELRPDPREFASVAWWCLDDLRAGKLERAEPHLGRFVTKIASASPTPPD